MPGAVEIAPASGPDPTEGPWERYLVLDEQVDVDVNFRDKRISGKVRITLFSLSSQLEVVHVDARQMDIDLENITVNGKKARAEYHDPYDNLSIPGEFDWDASQSHYQLDRISPLFDRRASVLPAESREGTGCTPAFGSLKIWLREEEPKPSIARVKVRLLSSAVPKAPAPSEDSAFEISIPFRSKSIRDGVHFVGVEENDTRYPHMYTINSNEPGLASCIFPCIDDPGSRSFWTVCVRFPKTLGDALKQPLVTQRSSGATASAEAWRPPTTPLTEEDKLLDMTVVCAGILVGEEIDKTDESKKVMTFEIRNKTVSPLHVGFAVGPFVHVDLWSGFRAEADDDRLGEEAIKIHGYCLPGREDEVRYSCEALAQAADFFATKFGKFPFDSYKVCFVEDMVAETSPLCSLSLCSTRLLYPIEVIDMEQEVMGKLVHALACQYFGVHIIANTPLDSWITIGVAHFIADLYMAQLCGINDYRFRVKMRADQLVEEDINRLPLDQLGNYMHLGDHQRDFMALKAPLVLFILDRRLTKRAAHNGLRRVISKIVSQALYKVGDSARVVSSQSFRKLCERISHNSASLELFWQQWVHSSGCARFEMSHRYNKKHSRIDVAVKQPEERKDLPPPALTKDNFWGALQDRRYVPHGKKSSVSVWFTGPITIGIHEANGTPYEHVAEIRRMGPKMFKTLEMPYNTKYKRLKRTRRQRERAAATAAQADANGEGAEDAVLYSLGDVLQNPDEIEAWQMADWTPEQEKAMESDSFEWLRLDADFEWLCTMRSNMQPWMYVSQLQQDRDVVAQQESVLYMSQKQGGEIAASFLAKTLMDRRYFHGIRTLAIRALQKQVWTREEEVTDPVTGQTSRVRMTVLGGLSHLMRAFQSFFCFDNTQTPQPNDFGNKMQYMVQSAIPAAIARVRDNGRCPPQARRFILEQLRFNNNSSNEFSDHFYVAGLLDALATSLVPEPTGDALHVPRRDDDPAVLEEQAFLADVLQEIERYVRMDEWAHSYHNIWTTTALSCKQKLMKAGVIPVSPLDFVQYLQDGTLDLVQIKAFEALVDLGFLLHRGVLRLLLAFMTTHHSPFVRDRLFKVFSWGVAGLAFGEYSGLSFGQAPGRKGSRADTAMQEGSNDVDDGVDGGDDNVIMMEHADAILKKKKTEEARRSTIEGATKALRQEIAKVENASLLLEIWRAVCSPVIGLVEQRNLLDMCQTLFDPDFSCRIIVKHPMRWVAERVPPKPGAHHSHPVISFKQVPRAFGPRPEPPPPEVIPGAETTALTGVKPGPEVVMTPGIAPAVVGIIGAASVAAALAPAGVVLPAPAPVPTPMIQRQPSGKIKIVSRTPSMQQQKQHQQKATSPIPQPQPHATVNAVAARGSIAVASPSKEVDASSISVVPSAAASPQKAEPSASTTPTAAGLTAADVDYSNAGATAKRPKSNKRKHENGDSGGPVRKLVKLKCQNYFERLTPETQAKIRSEESSASASASASRHVSATSTPASEPVKVGSTIQATPTTMRKPLPTGSSSALSAAAGPSAGSPLQALASSAQKNRKRLPSAAPTTTGPTVVLPPLQPSATAAMPPAEPPRPGKITLKLKIKKPTPNPTQEPA